MKNILQAMFLTLATTAGIALASVLLTSPVAANDNSAIINGLIPKQPNFFQQGREQFEREIQLLINSSRTNKRTVLKVIPNNSQIQEQLSPLEKPQVSPSEPKKSEPN